MWCGKRRVCFYYFLVLEGRRVVWEDERKKATKVCDAIRNTSVLTNVKNASFFYDNHHSVLPLLFEMMTEGYRLEWQRVRCTPVYTPAAVKSCITHSSCRWWQACHIKFFSALISERCSVTRSEAQFTLSGVKAALKIFQVKRKKNPVTSFKHKLWQNDIFEKKPVTISRKRQRSWTFTATALIQDTGDKKAFLWLLLEGRLEAGWLSGAWNPAREPTVQSLSVLKLAHSFNDRAGRE